MGRAAGPPEELAGSRNRKGPFYENLISDDPISDDPISDDPISDDSVSDARRAGERVRKEQAAEGEA